MGKFSRNRAIHTGDEMVSRPFGQQPFANGEQLDCFSPDPGHQERAIL